MDICESIVLFLISEDEPFGLRLRNSLKENVTSPVHVRNYTDTESCCKNLHLKADFVLCDYSPMDTKRKAFLRQFRSGTRIILLSEEEKMELAVEAMKLGAFDCLVKNEEGISKIINLVEDYGFLLNGEAGLERNRKQQQANAGRELRPVYTSSQASVFFSPFVWSGSGIRKYVYPRRKNAALTVRSAVQLMNS